MEFGRVIDFHFIKSFIYSRNIANDQAASTCIFKNLTIDEGKRFNGTKRTHTVLSQGDRLYHMGTQKAR